MAPSRARRQEWTRFVREHGAMSEEPELTGVPAAKYPPQPPPEPGTMRDVVGATMDGALLAAPDTEG